VQTSEGDELTGRVVLVAHSESSIGQAVVKRLTAEGVSVETVGESETSAWLRLGELERLDGLVVAAPDAVVQPFPSASLEEYRMALRENLRTTFFMVQRAVRAMKDGGRVCVSSPRRPTAIEDHIPAPATMFEGGLIAMVRLLAVEVAPLGVAVNGVCPVGAGAEDDSVASTLAFLGSADASYLTGTFIPVTN
jgi:NAD(P)-dependent dehydrogenase (short-subunit alcohol dehydrogenase family)